MSGNLQHLPCRQCVRSAGLFCWPGCTVHRCKHNNSMASLEARIRLLENEIIKSPEAEDLVRQLERLTAILDRRSRRWAGTCVCTAQWHFKHLRLHSLPLLFAGKAAFLLGLAIVGTVLYGSRRLERELRNSSTRVAEALDEISKRLEPVRDMAKMTAISE
jgi:hypothetical protein